MTPRPAVQWPGQWQAGSGMCTLACNIIGWNIFKNIRIILMTLIVIIIIILFLFLPALSLEKSPCSAWLPFPLLLIPQTPAKEDQ